MSGRASRQSLLRDWLIVRRRCDGLKLRELASEFDVSSQFAHQVVTRASKALETWRQQHGICGHCGVSPL